jgi:hypothetical protein
MYCSLGISTNIALSQDKESEEQERHWKTKEVITKPSPQSLGEDPILKMCVFIVL